jgi:tRNA G37 N-methylase TrmD
MCRNRGAAGDLSCTSRRQGEVLNDRLVRELARKDRLVLVCGRYEGVDERFVKHCVDREVSIGDYILTGGELPAMVLIDAVARHIPGLWEMKPAPRKNRSSAGCWSIRNTRGRLNTRMDRSRGVAERAPRQHREVEG